MNHLPFTQYIHFHTHNTYLHNYIVQQTTYLHQARVKVKMVHASFVVVLIPPPLEVSHVKNNYLSTNPPGTFLVRSCFTSNGCISLVKHRSIYLHYIYSTLHYISFTSGSRAPLSQDLFSAVLSLALLRMHACRSARAAAHTCEVGDPTNTYLYCIYALVGEAISIRDSRLCAND